MTEPSRSDEAPGATLRVAHPNRLRNFGRGLALPALAMLALAPLGWLADAPPIVWAATALFPASLALVFTAPALAASFLTSSYYGPGQVRFDGTTLSYDQGARMLSREIALVWHQDPLRVRVQAVDGTSFSIKFVHAEDAAGFVRTVQTAKRGREAYALPLDADSVRLVKDYLYWTVPAVVAVPFIAASPFLAAPAAAAALACGVVGMRRHPELQLGADGVRIRRRLSTRFVRYADIEGVQHLSLWYGHRVVITLHDGDELTLPVMDRTRASLVAGLLREGVQMHESGLAAGANLAALEAGDDLDEWKTRAETAFAKGADYRAAAIEPEKVSLLMRNPAASPTQRVGAALAMRNAPAGRQQIRVAADVSTDPAVKEALELLGAEDAELDAPALEKALARVRQA